MPSLFGISFSPMTQDITLKPSLEFGFVPTHAGFVETLIPNEEGLLPRSESGSFRVVDVVQAVLDRTKAKVGSVQVPIFPGAKDEEWDAMISALKDLGIQVCLVMMVGGVNPMDPADEDGVLAQLLPVAEAAKRNGVTHISSTSIEQWMLPGAVRLTGEEFETAVAQNVKLHARAYQEAGLADSCVENWHIEFLRPGEFQTFTDLGRLWKLVKALNEEIGNPFFRCLIDAAHCGDSPLSIEENQALIAEVAAGGGLGVMHASAPTTRGCLSTDDGWVSAILGAAARTGEMKQVFVEMFDHEDEALQPLRELDSGHGVDTRDGRDYVQVVADGLENTARVLNNYVARGIIPGA